MRHKVVLLSVAICGFGLLTSCGQTDAAKQADEAMDEICQKNISEITLYDYETIDNADALLAALSDKEKNSLYNLSAYEVAHEQYNKVYADAVTAAETAITNIGDVTLDSKNDIAEAEKCISSVPEDLRSTLIPNLDVYSAAQEEYAKLCVQNAIDLINNIGEVSVDSKPDIDDASTAYNALSAEQKKQVENWQILENAKAKYDEILEQAEAEEAAAAEARKNALIATMKVTKDEFKECTFYEPSRLPKYNNSRSCILPYIGQRTNGHKWLVIRYNYAGDDWVFFTKVTILADGKKYTKEFSYFDITHGSGGGVVGELYDDTSTTSADIKMLEDMATSAEVKARFEGSDYYRDVTIGDKDKAAIKDVLELYELL